MMSSKRATIIFAKAAVPGAVKTRLIPTLGETGAAMLHAALVERALETAQRSMSHSKSQVELCCAPDQTHIFFQTCAEDFDVALADQGAGNLGERMLRALDRALQTHDAAAIVGADCPAVTAKHINAAFAALDNNDVVLIPAEDGGYVLIAAKRTDTSMFDGIDWGTDTVLAQQHTALARTNLTVTTLETLWDVDRPEDLARLRTLVPPLDFFWPESA